MSWDDNPFRGASPTPGGPTAWRDPEFKLARDIRPWLENMGLVKGIIDREQLSLMYGLPSCGKTFLALDRDLSIAAGLPWFGHKTRQGPVVYLACEAGRTIENRIWAWLQAHQLDGQDIPFAVITSPIDLCHLSVGDVDRVADTIRTRIAWAELALLEIDTVSRALAGGDENGPADMGAFVHAMDMFRGAFHCHVSGVHHISGKGTGRGGPRGHSCLPAAMDTEQEVTRLGDSKISRMTINKRRDGVAGEELYFELPQIRLGQDEDGDDVTTCIIKTTEAPAADKGGNSSIRLSDQDKIALRALTNALATEGKLPPASNHIPAHTTCVLFEQWRDYAYNSGITGSGNPESRQKAFKRSSDRLIASERVCRWQALVWMP
jgi:hypothetical protein